MLPSSDVFTREDHRQDDPQTGVVPPSLRRGLLRGIAIASCAIGLVCACTASHPSVLSTLGTPQLLGIMILSLGPVLTVGAMRFDRRVAAQPVASQTGTSSDDHELRVTQHGPHDRSTPMHVHIEETHETKRVREPAA